MAKNKRKGFQRAKPPKGTSVGSASKNVPSVVSIEESKAVIQVSRSMSGILVPIRRDLFFDWLEVLMPQDLGVPLNGGSNSGTGGQARQHRYQISSKSSIQVSIPSDGKKIEIDAPVTLIEKVVRICVDARQKAEAGDFGSPIWWKFKLESKSELNPVSMLHMMRNLGQHTRYHGDFTLGLDGIVKIRQLGKEGDLAFFPHQTFEVFFQSVGPGHGPFSKSIAMKWYVLICGLLTLATSAHLGGIPVLFKANQSDQDEALSIIGDKNRCEFHIKGMPVWSNVVRFHTPETIESFDRFLGAMQAYEQALCQQNDGAAIIFFVTSIEALASPNASWRHERVTKRFVDFLLLLCTDVLEESLNHANFESAFGAISTPKKFAESIYKIRSSRVHTGKFGQIDGGVFSGDMMSGIRVALVSEIARSAIIRFFSTPLSMLTGHPNFHPKITLNPTPDVYQKFDKRSKSEKYESIDKWLLALAEDDLSR